jgi:arylsulfatase A-like enzyme
MSVPSEPGGAPADGPEPFSGLRAAAGLIAGFALLAIVDAGAIAIGVPMPRAGIGLRALHYAFDAAETLGVGALLGALVGVFSAFVRLPPAAYVVVYASATAAVQYTALADDLYRQASVALEGRLETPLFVLFVVSTGLAVPVAHVLGASFSGFRRLRLLPAAIGVAGMIGDHLYLRDDYFGPHGFIAWVAATLAGAALAPPAERAIRALVSSRRGRAAALAVAAFAIAGVVVPPPNAVRFELFRQPCAVAPWALATAVWPTPHPHAPVQLPLSPWLTDRSSSPGIAANRPPLLGASPVVVLITIDAVRADAVLDPKNDALFPTLTELKRKGVTFTNATSPGSQTAVSLTATFSDRYFSELAWAMHGTGSTRFAYAADDPSPRFPQILTDRKVSTSIYCSINFLAAEFGVARGFAEERVIPEGRRHAYARQMIDPVLDRLRRAKGGEPLFIYTHLMEPHAPYDRGRRDGTEWEKYLSEIAVADSQIQRVLRLLEQRFGQRWLLIVSADHGEAFGEHETYQHTKTLYEELLRVPLLVRGPALAPRTIDEHVGLVDLGPTLLDLFGAVTPGTFEGQSLVPLLTGRGAVLDRPLLAEGRLRRALYMPDGLKVILDTRRETVEVYDLLQDPGETHNLFDEAPSRADPALATLQTFFAVHAYRRPGYRAPYKP